MKKLFAAVVSAAALCGASAFAADMPMKAPAYKAVAPGYSWTGFYVGGSVGYIFGDWGYTLDTFTSTQNHLHGAIGGPTIGFNWQSGAFVFGVEGDYSWSAAKAIDLSGCTAPGCENKHPWFATARARIGYVFDRFMPYVTGGAAFTRSEQTFLVDGSDFGKKNLNGWTIGGGVEWAWAQNWSAKVEYLHADFGNQDIFNPDLDILVNVSNNIDLNIVRVGLNYRFGY